MFQVVQKSVKVGDKTVTFETGRIARQAHGGVLVSCGDTQVLVAVVGAKEASPSASFFPLAVDYIEKMYAAGRLPGGYVKRETRPSDREILVSRLIDRPVRPLFPENFFVEVQIVATVLSFDPTVSPDMLAIMGASAALHLSDLPWAGPIGSMRIGYKAATNQYLVNCTDEEADASDLHLVVAGTKDAILMVEAVANFVSEEVVLEAMNLAHKEIKKICDMIEDLRSKAGKPKRLAPELPSHPAIEKGLKTRFAPALVKVYSTSGKSERKAALEKVRQEARAALVPADDAVGAKHFEYFFEMACYNTMRMNILNKDMRIDGRTTKDIRNIDCQIGILKRPHGSALFTRGETQSLGVITLGTKDECQRSESLRSSLEERHFMLNYNMPGYSVGEPKRLGTPGRREVGHGNLAERALRGAIPSSVKFPYTIRLVSEITESNGSSSMATVCSGSLALLDAGVPISEPIAGIAMGLIKEGEDFAVLSDILGDEDALGDMDFKVAGGKSGITALQMDIKISGIPLQILKIAIEQAKEGRNFILGKILKTINKPNDLSPRAPRVERIKIKPEKVRDLIGPGGKNIKRIIADSGCKVDVDEAGVVSIASMNGEQAQAAKRMIHSITSDPEIGEIYLGIVKKTAEFGAFVEIKPGIEGLVHISQLDSARVQRTEDVVKEGDEVMVKVIELDRTGRIKLSRKDAIGKQPTARKE